MTKAPIEDLLDRQVLFSNSLATVMPDCVAVRDGIRQAHTVVDISRVSGITRTYTTRPGLLVIAAGLLLIAAASYYSKEGGGAAFPIALCSGAFAAAYFLTRRASVIMMTDFARIETMYGSFIEAAQVFSAIAALRFRNAQPKTSSDIPNTDFLRAA